MHPFINFLLSMYNLKKKIFLEILKRVVPNYLPHYLKKQ